MDHEALQMLVRRCQQTLPDDTRAFEELVGLYKVRIFATAYRIMQNRDEAEDQSQEVFLKVYRNIRGLEDPATFTTWIYRITEHQCYDALTKQQRRPATQPLEPQGATHVSEYVDQTTPLPDALALQGELRQCIERALAELDQLSRTVLVLRDIEDRPYQEIADLLKIGLSAVKMRIHRTRLLFQHVLNQVCPGVGQTGPTTGS